MDSLNTTLTGRRNGDLGARFTNNARLRLAADAELVSDAAGSSLPDVRMNIDGRIGGKRVSEMYPLTDRAVLDNEVRHETGAALVAE